MSLYLAYIAGAYSAPTRRGIRQNIRKAQIWADAVNRTGLIWAVTPHLLSTGIEDSLPELQWRACTLELSRRCDGLFLIPQWSDSSGSVGEFNAAGDDDRPWVTCPSIEKVADSVRALVQEIEHRQALKRAALVSLPPETLRRGRC